MLTRIFRIETSNAFLPFWALLGPLSLAFAALFAAVSLGHPLLFALLLLFSLTISLRWRGAGYLVALGSLASFYLATEPLLWHPHALSYLLAASGILTIYLALRVAQAQAERGREEQKGREEVFSKLKGEIEHLKQRGAEKEAALEEKVRRIEFLGLKLKEEQGRAQELERAVAEKRAALEEKTKEVEVLELKLKEEQGRAQELERVVVERGAALEERIKEIETLGRAVAEKRAVLEEKTKEVEVLELKLKEEQGRAQELERAVVEKGAALQKAEEELKVRLEMPQPVILESQLHVASDELVHLYEQLKRQFQEKSEVLSATRRQLFITENELFAVKLGLEESDREQDARSDALIAEMQRLEEERSALEIEAQELEKVLSQVFQKKPSRPRKASKKASQEQLLIRPLV